ncbi:LIC_10177 family protein [Leptonema illini]|uniref:Uncharacterized protein n=1 Tax=Leptonema illini DSM 21528 TaxID=929563 RepID=H2CL63_9LEPT|nr:hypothetical protein [Leptonema illini]EHQ08314.1 hypothetical protein Lepil_3657 [Leptonema illini DSM 21528]
MDATNAYKQVGGIEAAINQLSPIESTIDDVWIEQNQEALDELKAVYEDKGGIHVIEVGDSHCICRVPAREIMSRIAKKAQISKAADPLAQDLELFRLCLLFPRFESETVQRWLRDAPGLPTAVSVELMKIAKVTVEATSKKL